MVMRIKIQLGSPTLGILYQAAKFFDALGSNIDFAARPYTQQEHSWESVESDHGGWLFLWGLSHVTMFP